MTKLPVSTSTEERALAAFVVLRNALFAANEAMFELAREHGAQNVENAAWFFSVKVEAEVRDKIFPTVAERERWHNLCSAVANAADGNAVAA
jgi:hypothetical protein